MRQEGRHARGDGKGEEGELFEKQGNKSLESKVWSLEFNAAQRPEVEEEQHEGQRYYHRLAQ